MPDATPHVLVVTGGHPYEAEPFFAVFDALAADGVCTWQHAAAPAGHDRDGRRFDGIVFYDMPGLRFTRKAPPAPPVELVEPTDDQRAAFDMLTSAGVGLVFMHHAIASWPTWEGFAELIGGRFHYQPGTLAGVDYPDSGYVFDVEHTVEILDPDHPVCAGLPARFEITDELYCFPVLADDVIPLMRTQFPVDDPTRFFSADLAIRGQRNSNDGWTHPPGSDLVAWAKHVGDSRLVYLQFGDGPVTYADPTFRHALANAITWTS